MPLFVTIRHLSGSLAGKSQRIAMQEGQILRLGRAEGNDIRFSEAQEDSVSGHHAELSLQQGRLRIEDQCSSNGTFLDGAPCPPLQKVAVADGARLRLAQHGPEMQLALEVRPDRPAEGVPVAGPAAAPAKESVGKATLLREIEKARTEERGVMQQELTRTRKSGALWVGLGLLVLALLGGWGVSAGLRSNAEKSQEAQARLAAEQREALAKEKNIWSEVESRVNPSVVQVVCNYRLRSLRTLASGAQSAGNEFTGGVTASGVLIRPGVILTVLHAVEPWKYSLDWNRFLSEFKPEYDSLEVQFPGYQPLHARVDVTSFEHDLALLRVTETNAPAIEMGQSNADVKVTQRIAVLGYPGELGQYALTLASHGDPGKELRTRRELNPTFVYGAVAQPLGGGGPLSNFLYFDGSLSPGNSGGPVVNDRGQLIGIVTTRFEKPGAMFTFMNRTIASRMPIEPSNFAVSPDDIQSFLRQHGLL